jgi:hypothetical protein
VFALFSGALAALSEPTHLMKMFDSTIVHADVSARVDAALRKMAGKSDDAADRHPEAVRDKI